MFGFGRRSGGGKDGGGRGGDRPRNEEDDLLKVCVWGKGGELWIRSCQSHKSQV